MSPLCRIASKRVSYFFSLFSYGSFLNFGASLVALHTLVFLYLCANKGSIPRLHILSVGGPVKHNAI